MRKINVEHEGFTLNLRDSAETAEVIIKGKKKCYDLDYDKDGFLRVLNAPELPQRLKYAIEAAALFVDNPK